ncbi:MAG: NUDIX domain-containing protein [Candidatus Aenigmatarchaeota archaeon]
MKLDNIIKLRKYFNQYVMATAIIKRNKKYLLLQRSKHNLTNKYKWQFPEGGVEFGEKPIKTLERELKEEINLKLLNAKFLDCTSTKLRYLHQDVYHIIRIIFLCNVKGKIKLSKEHKAYKWFTKQEIKFLPLIKGLTFNSIKHLL